MGKFLTKLRSKLQLRLSKGRKSTTRIGVIPPIPDDVFIIIISHLHKPDLSRCCRVSRTLYPIAAARLYETIIFPPLWRNWDTDVVEDDMPKWFRRGKIDIGWMGEWFERIIRAHLSGSIVYNSSLLHLPKSAQPVSPIPASINDDQQDINHTVSQTSTLPFPSESQPSGNIVSFPPASPHDHPNPYPERANRLSFAKHLTLPLHTHKGCEDLAPLPHMPRLATLRINPAVHINVTARPDICICQHVDVYKGNPCTSVPPCTCNLISQLRPRHLIMGSQDTGFLGSPSGLWSSTHAPEWLKEVTFIVGEHGDDAEGRDPAQTFLDKLPESVNTLTLVMWTWKGNWFADRPWYYPSNMEDYLRSFTPEGLRSALALACCGKTKNVVVVGLETIMEGWAINPKKVRREIKEIKKEIQNLLVGMGWESGKAADRAQAIQFIEAHTHYVMQMGQGVDRAILRDVILRDWVDRWGHEQNEEDEY